MTEQTSYEFKENAPPRSPGAFEDPITLRKRALTQIISVDTVPD